LGQKVNPVGLRLGYIKKWQSVWFAEKNYSGMLLEDLKVRKFLKKKLYHAGISHIEIERAANKAKVNIYAARPGVIIGKKGSEIEKLKAEIEKFSKAEIIINILEVRKPETDAQLVAENVAMQLERRVAFRRAMKKCVGYALKFGAKGIKISCSGRLGGAEIARSEGSHDGSIPLQTMRADIQYGFAEAKTTYGRIGCKVWIYKGELLGKRGASDRREEGGK